MHIFVTGGSGRNGRLVIQVALSRGHTVTALVRNSDSLTAHPHLTIVTGTPTSQSDLETALQTPSLPSAIITALGIRRTTNSPFSPLAPDSTADFLSTTTATLLQAIDKVPFVNPPKLIVNSSLGVGASWSAMIFPFRMLFRYSNMRVTLQDHERVDEVVRKGGLPFVLARPAVLVEGLGKKVRVLPDDGKGMAWFATISRQSVAEWLVEAAETTEWDGRAPVITN